MTFDKVPGWVAWLAQDVPPADWEATLTAWPPKSDDSSGA